MTEREAIEILSRPFSMQKVPKEILDAHRLAISALEKQEQVNTQSVNSTHTTYPNALESLKILESAKDENGCVPMSLVRLAFRNVLEQDRWIPVTERLPEKDDFVLVAISGTTSNEKSWEHTMTLAVWTGDSWDLVDADMVDFRIFAWRPLPEPYTEDES